MNAGDGISGSTIKYCLKNYANKFDQVVVVDGDLTDEARQYYNQFSNLTVVDSPWTDSYVSQYRAWADVVEKEDWILYLDCDELPSPELLEFMTHENLSRADEDGFNTLCLPCVLWLTLDDGKTYAAVEPEPLKEFKGQWLKNILVKRKDLDFKYFGSHVIPTHKSKEKGKYIPFAYYHMKSLESFCVNDVWQAFLLPEGQHYSKIDAKIFKNLTKNYENTKDFKKSVKEGTWSEALKRFAWKNRRQYGSPISRLAWTYWILNGHEMPENDPQMTWENVRVYILGQEKLDRHEKNLKEGKIIEVER